MRKSRVKGTEREESGGKKRKKRGRWGREGRRWRQDRVKDQCLNYRRLPLLLGFYQAGALHRVLASPHLRLLCRLNYPVLPCVESRHPASGKMIVGGRS